MAANEFYDTQTEQSEIKTGIVAKYFWAWATVMKGLVKKKSNKIGYVDLFAGCGRYNDGSLSTPLTILQSAIADPEIRPILNTYFNEGNPDNAAQLREEIANLPDINLLKYKPSVNNIEVTDDTVDNIVFPDFPVLYFLDPWGYKGLSLRLVQAVIQRWGCDCLFFFNYNRINAALSNPVMVKNMNAFFGQTRANELRKAISGKTPPEREALIIEALKVILREAGGAYTIEYFFKDNAKGKTSHFLIFVSKNPLGYKIMKTIMAKEGSEQTDGFSNFGFNPKDKLKNGQPSLFDIFPQLTESPVNELADELLKIFAGETLLVKEIFYKHNLGTNAIMKNYQDALKQLEAQAKITANPPAEQRKRIADIVTMSENVVITFPEIKT